MDHLLSLIGFGSTTESTTPTPQKKEKKQVTLKDVQEKDYRAVNTFAKLVLLNISKPNLKKDASVPNFKKKKVSYNRFILLGCPYTGLITGTFLEQNDSI